MTVIRLLISLIHAVLVVSVQALVAGLALLLSSVTAVVVLVGVVVAGLSSFGGLGLFWRRKRRSGRDDAAS
jgi:hypothetical protein